MKRSKFLSSNYSIVFGLITVGFLKSNVALAYKDFGGAVKQCRGSQDRWSKAALQETGRAYFGVFDGRSSSKVPKRDENVSFSDGGELKLLEGNYENDPALMQVYDLAARDLFKFIEESLSLGLSAEKAIVAGYIKADADIIVKEKSNSVGRGTTASLVMEDVKADRLYIANIGDSPVILGFKPGSSKSWEQVSVDHGTSNPSEVKRMGTVGRPKFYKDPLYFDFETEEKLLMCSRSLGDSGVKRHYLSNSSSQQVKEYYESAAFVEHLASFTSINPENESGNQLGSKEFGPYIDKAYSDLELNCAFDLSPIPAVNVQELHTVDFAVIASDGVISPFNGCNPEKLVEKVREMKGSGISAQDIAAALMSEAVDRQGTDDKTVLVIFF